MNNRSNIVTGAVVVFVATLGAIVALALAVDDGARVESLVVLILSAASTLVLALLALDRVAQVGAKVDQVGKQTTDLTNGLLDAKVRAALADILAPHLIDPAADDQLVADRARRDGINDHHGETPPAI